MRFATMNSGTVLACDGWPSMGAFTWVSLALLREGQLRFPMLNGGKCGPGIHPGQSQDCICHFHVGFRLFKSLSGNWRSG